MPATHFQLKTLTFVMVLGSWYSQYLLFPLIFHSSWVVSFCISFACQVKKSHRSRRAQRPRPRRPSTAMGALTLWTPQPRPVLAATAHRCLAPTTQSSSRSSNSRKRSSSKALTCTFSSAHFSNFLNQSVLRRLQHFLISNSQFQQKTKERNPVPSRARHAGYNSRRSCTVFAPGREA